MSRTLFDDPAGRRPPAAPEGPLADRMRPRSLGEVLGQEALAGEQGSLRRAIAEDRVPSMVFWGPPGTGKTTLARIIAGATQARFVPFSAVTSGIKEVKEVMAEAERWRGAQGGRTLLFVDEIHRFNRAQQDAFLPYVESGAITLVGATTQNPSFELNSALLSRLQVVVLAPLSVESLVTLQERALADAEHGLARRGVTAEPEALEAVAVLASGDARRALNLLEQAIEDSASRGVDRLDASSVREIAQRKVLRYDKAGEEHYDLISALHKSLRESDPDAALYWLERMLVSGEDPKFLARRLVRFAVEDVGLADPRALPLALAAWDAYDRLGSPEGELALSEAALYLALAPKSHAVYAAAKKARKAIEERPAEPVPPVIRNAPTRLMEELGYGEGYVYAPETEEGMGGLDCLPESLRGLRLYQPKGAGFEAELAERRKRLDALRERLRRREPGYHAPEEGMRHVGGKSESRSLGAAIASVLVRHPEVIGAYLFGSRARGVAASTSDVDVAVAFDDSPTVERLVDLEDEIERAVDLPMEVIDLGRAGAFVALEAVRGERIFERDGRRLDELDLYILRRAGDLAHFERERRSTLLGREAK